MLDTCNLLLLCYSGEGKSFLFSPWRSVFGVDGVMERPDKGCFPLIGLEMKGVVLLDEWRFDESILSLPVQLLWLEGKPVPLPQPQNTGDIGHKLYNGSAPIFITTKMQYLEKLVREAGAAEAADESSVIARVACTHSMRGLRW